MFKYHILLSQEEKEILQCVIAIYLRQQENWDRKLKKISLICVEMHGIGRRRIRMDISKETMKLSMIRIMEGFKWQIMLDYNIKVK